MYNRLLLVVVFCVFLLSVTYASQVPIPGLIAPEDSNLTTVNNVTFMCNVTDDEHVYRISLYHNINGIFSLNSTRNIMELGTDTNTTFLCHFNNTYTCVDGETGTNSSTSFVSGKFLTGLLVNETDTLSYPTSGNVLGSKGSIEFWFRVGKNTSDTSWLFSTGPAASNDLQIYISSDALTFDLHDSSAYTATAYRSVSWNQGEWHHVVAVWDVNNPPAEGGQRADLYLDGTNENVTQDDYYTASMGSLGTTMYIGTKHDGTSNSNATFDEFRISSEVRTKAQINESYFKGANNHSFETANFTVTNIPDGNYLWNCLGTDNESQVNFSTSNFTVGIDTTSPSINQIILSPNSTGDLDPDMIVNVTANITDTSTIDTVIFQWKETGNWNNDSMGYDAGTGFYVNATLTIDVTGGVYFYRIWANDSLGRSGYSTTQNLTAGFDYTWTVSPSDMGVVSGYVSTGTNVVNLTVNNTGDDTLGFTFSDDWPFNVTYNSSVDPTYYVPASTAITVLVNATFETQTNERNVTFTVTASHGTETPTPVTNTTVGALNSFIGGAYLTTAITVIPTVVNQSQTGININATIKNIGNETAHNVTVNWTFPTGWTNTSGYIEWNLTNITSQVTNRSDLVMSLSSSAPSGLSSICINATSWNTSSLSCDTVQVSCSSTDGECGSGCTYNNDADCPGPTVTGGGGGGGGAPSALVKNPVLSISAPLRIDTFRGMKAVFDVTVGNTQSGTTANDVKLSITGHPQTLIKITPSKVDKIKTNLETFNVVLTIPEYMQYGSYNLTVKASATSVDTVARIILFVQDVEKNETIEIFSRAQQSVEEMIDSGYNSEAVSILLDQAEEALDNEDFDSAKDISEKIIATRDSAFNVYSTLEDIEKSMQEADAYGIDYPETRKFYTMAVMAADRGDFEKAEERLNNALLTQSSEINTRLFIIKYWPQLLAGAIILIVLAVFVHRIILLKSKDFRIKYLEREERIIMNLIKSLQVRRFEKRDMGKREYDDGVDEYRKRLAEIKREKSRLSAKKIRILSIKGVERDLVKQREHITKLIREIQKKRFDYDLVSKNTYEETVRELKDELAEIDKKLEEKKHRKSYVLAIFLVVIFSSVGFADNTTMNNAALAIEAAELDIIEMQQLGFAVTRVNDTLAEAKLLYSRGEYVAAESVAKYIDVLKRSAANIDSLIEDAENAIYEADVKGIDVSAASELVTNGIDAFRIERYEESESLLKQAIDKVDQLETQFTLETTAMPEMERLLVSVKTNWQQFLVMVLAAFAVLAAVFFVFRKIARKMRIRTLEHEKASIESIMKTIQRKYFEENTMAKSEYIVKAEKYQKRLGKIRKEISLLKGRNRPS